MNRDERERLRDYLADRKALIERTLAAYLPGEATFPPLIFQAVRYSVLAGGKRLRPILCLAAAEAVGGAIEPVLPVACGIELIHTYSLIHDDLPAMDNDDTRRGKPTSHKVFGEDVAILAGDALLTEAFRLMTRRDLMPGVPAERLLDAVGEIAEAAGFFGMVGGQVLDIRAEGKPADLDSLHRIHRMKTGAMIKVALRAGAMLSGAPDSRVAALSLYGEHIGLAFQVVDDILNVAGDRTLLGKGTGSDAARGKVTFPAVLGLEGSRARVEALVIEALAALVDLDERAEPLRRIARFIPERTS